MRKLTTEALKFIVVGAANFLLTLVVFAVALKVLAIDYLLSLVAAWIVGIGFSYVLNFTWVFRPEKKLQFRSRLVKYLAASTLSISVNLLALRLIVEAGNFDPFVVQLALIPLIVAFNFATAKLWSLKPGGKGLR